MDVILIDINCDVGEGIPNEAQLFPFISSCNIACGGHTGDCESMTKTARLAIKHKVKIGAHPSYPDKKNFGRKTMNISDNRLKTSIKQQISLLIDICNQENTEVKHIKPHGALYNDVARDGSLSELFLDAIAEYKTNLELFVPYGSMIERLARKNGFKTKIEAFADRNYNSDLSLVSRSEPHALIEKPFEVLNHLIRIVKKKRVLTISKEFKPLNADTYCIHGDTSGALQILMYISEELPKHQIALKK